jgi:hypothetical protein
MRPELAGANNSPEVFDPLKAFERLNKLYNSGRLHQAVGQSQSEDIIQHADAAFLNSRKSLHAKEPETVGRSLRRPSTRRLRSSKRNTVSH